MNNYIQIKSKGRKRTFVFSLLLLSRHLIVILPISILIACGTMSYYRPESTSGEVTSALCPPVHSVILFESNGIVAGFKAYSVQEELVRLLIELQIPEGHVIRLLDKVVTVKSITGEQLKSQLKGLKSVSLSQTTEISLDKPLLGSTKKSFIEKPTLSGITKHAYYLLKTEFEIIKNKEFSITPPSFTVDNKRVDLPIIRFILDQEFVVTGINC